MIFHLLKKETCREKEQIYGRANCFCAQAGGDGSLVELNLKPRLRATARFAYVTLAGRTEAPAMAYFRQFLRAHLNE